MNNTKFSHNEIPGVGVYFLYGAFRQRGFAGQRELIFFFDREFGALEACIGMKHHLELPYLGVDPQADSLGRVSHGPRGEDRSPSLGGQVWPKPSARSLASASFFWLP